MRKRTCKNPKFDVIVCCQGQPFHYYCSTLIGALVEYGYQYMKNKKYGTMNFSLKQRLCETVHPAMQLSDYGKCAEEHRQLAEWLKDYKRLKEQEPSDDAISRQAVLDAIDVKAWEFCDYLISKNRNDEQKPVSHFADNLRECVREELPSVNPQSKTGHWTRELIRNEKGGCIGAKMICSECGNDNKHDEYMNCCPNCGARMQESEG